MKKGYKKAKIYFCLERKRREREYGGPKNRFININMWLQESNLIDIIEKPITFHISSPSVFK